MNIRKTCMLLACTLPLVACDILNPTDELSSEDAEFLAQEMDAMLESMLDETAGSGIPGAQAAPTLAPVTTTFTYERTRECPAGGTVAVEGSGSRVVDRETVTVDVEQTGTRTRTACTRARGDVVITTDGSGTFTHERHWLDHAPTGSWITTVVGEFIWTKGEVTGTCSYDLTATIDTAANTKSLVGTFCDRAIDRSATWRDG